MLTFSEIIHESLPEGERFAAPDVHVEFHIILETFDAAGRILTLIVMLPDGFCGATSVSLMAGPSISMKILVEFTRPALLRLSVE